MNTSLTVQAAQRLLAEREALGLKKYGTTVDRTDLQAADWLQHAIEEASDLLLYLIRLRQTMHPAPAAAPEDAERAAYLERWKDAPEWAEWVSQDGHRWCVWHERQPHEQGSFWRPDGAAKVAGAGHNLLGSVRCEPRPKPEGGQGVGP